MPIYQCESDNVWKVEKIKNVCEETSLFSISEWAGTDNGSWKVVGEVRDCSARFALIF